MVLTLLSVSFYVILLALLTSFLRFLKGPTCVDRMVALDTMTVVGISLIVLLAVSAGRNIYLDVALVYALLSFLGGIAVARYLERGI
ncbi:MAG: cation:proton antiporter [Candidatus Syntrophosphaera sp.]|nr:cation:proton antiporter [Candidatus Syntrophosphaera sp.]